MTGHWPVMTLRFESRVTTSEFYSPGGPPILLFNYGGGGGIPALPAATLIGFAFGSPHDRPLACHDLAVRIPRGYLQADPARWSSSTAIQFMAEGAGFEPARPFGPAVFKTAAFNHSATPPQMYDMIPQLRVGQTCELICALMTAWQAQPSRVRRLRGATATMEPCVRRMRHIWQWR